MAKIRVFLIIIVLFFIGVLVIYPAQYMHSVYSGLLLFAVSVLPALFPFFFFSKILTSLDIASSFSKFASKPLKKLFNAPPVSAYILILSMLSGYPIGAKLVSDSCSSGLMTNEEAKNTIAFCSTSGPLFVLGTVGSSMLLNYKAGVIILIAHYIGAIINGLVWKNKSVASTENVIPKVNIDYDNILSESVYSSIVSVFMVGAYIAIFNMILDIFTNMGLISLLAKPLSYIGIPFTLAEGGFASVIEITRGALLLSSSGQSLKIIVPMLAATISFGGMSVTLQALTFLSKCKIKPLYYLAVKFTHCIIAFFVALIICYFMF